MSYTSHATGKPPNRSHSHCLSRPRQRRCRALGTPQCSPCRPVALFLNEATRLPVFVLMAPTATVTQRFP